MAPPRILMLLNGCGEALHKLEAFFFFSSQTSRVEHGEEDIKVQRRYTYESYTVTFLYNMQIQIREAQKRIHLSFTLCLSGKVLALQFDKFSAAFLFSLFLIEDLFSRFVSKFEHSVKEPRSAMQMTKNGKISCSKFFGFPFGLFWFLCWSASFWSGTLWSVAIFRSASNFRTGQLVD